VSPPDFNLGVDYWTQIYQEFANTSGNVSPNLLIDALAAIKEPAKVDSAMDQIRSVARTVKNRPELAAFLSQPDVIQRNCFPRGLWQN
jgi:hypothetical protein